MDIVFQIVLFTVGYLLTLAAGAALEEKNSNASWAGILISLPVLLIAAFGFSQ